MNPKEILDSWKEIATFLRRGVRTVQRWEATEGLPVRRHNHQKRGSVYALPAEVAEWQRSRQFGSRPAVRQGKTHKSGNGVPEEFARMRALMIRQQELALEVQQLLSVRGKLQGISRSAISREQSITVSRVSIESSTGS